MSNGNDMDVPFGEDRYPGSHILMRRSLPLQIGRGPGLMWMPILLLVLATSVSEVQSKAYLVFMNDSPVVHYDGSISGHVATAAVRDTTLDYTSIQAEFSSTDTSLLKTLGPASPFDMGAGQVNPSAALDSGLVFEAGIDDYIKFLCLISTATSSEVRNATALGCPKDLSGYPLDLNTPYISVGVLQSSRVVSRTVTNVGKSHEFFTLGIESPANISSTPYLLRH